MTPDLEEAVARIIDPEGWTRAAEMLALHFNGRPAPAYGRAAEFTEPSLTKARSILAIPGLTGGEEDEAQVFTDDRIRQELSAFYDRVNYPEPRRSRMVEAFEISLERDGKWPSIVLKDLGFVQVRGYLRVGAPKDQRPLPSPPKGAAG